MKPALKETPNIDGSRFLFIAGLHRSGTSILHRLLQRHVDCTALTQSGMPQDEGQHLQSVFPTAATYGGPGLFAFDKSCRLTEKSQLVSHANRDKLLREWCAYYDLSKLVLLEKSPPNIVRSRFLQALFPGCRFVFIVRHPVAVSLATQKWSRTSLESLLSHWHIAHKIMYEDMGYLHNKVVVRYEDLVARPQQSLDNLCTANGLSTFIATEQLIDRNADYYSLWTSKHVDVCNNLALRQPDIVDFAGRFGYRLQEPFAIDPTAPLF